MMPPAISAKCVALEVDAHQCASWFSDCICTPWPNSFSRERKHHESEAGGIGDDIPEELALERVSR